jgi:hypothetical protein
VEQFPVTKAKKKGAQRFELEVERGDSAVMPFQVEDDTLEAWHIDKNNYTVGLMLMWFDVLSCPNFVLCLSYFIWEKECGRLANCRFYSYFNCFFLVLFVILMFESGR